MLVVGAPHELPQINCRQAMVGGQALLNNENKPSSRKACFSFAAYAKHVIKHMRRCHISIAEGLSDDEFSSIESTFGFIFPPDLRSILQEGLPTGANFPQWREGSHSDIRSWLDLPISALCSEVRCGKFWPSKWGARPSRTADAARTAAHELALVPTLVPVYANCYISCFPVQAGNPVFLVQESTILYCGYDLADFFKRQAFVPRRTDLSCMPSMLELQHAGLSMIKEQINMQRSAASGTTDSYKHIAGSSGGAVGVSDKDGIKMDSSMAVWRWADESPRMPMDVLPHVHTNGNHHYQHVKADASSPSPPPPPPPTPSPSLSSSSSTSSSSSSSSSSSPPSSSTSSPESNRNSQYEHRHFNSSSSSSSSSSRRTVHDSQRVGVIRKKYLYFHEKPLPSRMLNKFTMAAPPWAATQARKIDFWSDMAEGHCIQPTTSHPTTPRTPRRLHTAYDYIIDHKPAKHCSYPILEQECGDHQLEYTISCEPALKPCNDHPVLDEKHSDQNEYVINFQPAKRCRSNHLILVQKCSGSNSYINEPANSHTHSCRDHLSIDELTSRHCTDHVAEYDANQSEKLTAHNCAWLSTYLDGLADALRKGRWGEADIDDMLLQSTSGHSASCHPYTHISAAKLQSCLQQAGWSNQDTLQML